MKKISALLCLCLFALSSCRTSEPRMADDDHRDDRYDDRHDDRHDDRRDRDDDNYDDDDDNRRRHWWN